VYEHVHFSLLLLSLRPVYSDDTLQDAAWVFSAMEILWAVIINIVKASNRCTPKAVLFISDGGPAHFWQKYAFRFAWQFARKVNLSYFEWSRLVVDHGKGRYESRFGFFFCDAFVFF
jgi:hypothetical protein